jgi:cell division protein FtsQ
MKVNWNYIKMIGVLLLVVFLYAFSSGRNAKRIVAEPQVEFLGEHNLFITQSNVSKLLIQSYGGAPSVTKETLDLNAIENTLNSNPMIQSAEAFISVSGRLTTKIRQKQPIARVAKHMYYVDSQGGIMPLSKNYSERVPLVTGDVNEKELNTIYTIANAIYNDEFLKKNVIVIHQNKDESIDLKLRQCGFTVQLGRLNFLEKKINNLKAFYKKATKDKLLDKYSKVNLQFESQVVCTKV